MKSNSLILLLKGKAFFGFVLFAVLSQMNLKAQGTFTYSYGNYIGDNPYANICHDFNGDGNTDIACCNWNVVDRLTIFAGSGNGTFSVAANYTLVNFGISMTGADVNSDGVFDLILLNNLPGIDVLMGNSNGTFNSAVSYTFPIGGISGWCIGDFDGDNDRDIALGNNVSNTFNLLLGSPTGTFGPATGFQIASGSLRVCSDDFNNDGFDDIACGTANGNIVIFPGNTLGTFSGSVSISGSSAMSDLKAADMNNDGNPDLISCFGSVSNINVMMGGGNLTFSPPLTYTHVVNTYNLNIIDVNCDGYMDVIPVVGFPTASKSFHVRLGSATGTLSTPIMAPNVVMNPVTIALGEFNNDGRVDLVTGNQTNYIKIFINALDLFNVMSSATGVLCQGKPVTLTATGPGSFTWTGGIQNGIAFTPTASIIYTVVGTVGSCTMQQTKTVNVYPVPIMTVAAAMNRTITCVGETANYSHASGAASWTLNGAPLFANPFPISPQATTTYTLKVKTMQNGCIDSTTFTHYVSNCESLHELFVNQSAHLYPNPNSGKFILELQERESLGLRIFNSQGQAVHSTVTNGQVTLINLPLLATGIYFYELEALKGISRRGKFLIE